MIPLRKNIFRSVSALLAVTTIAAVPARAGLLAIDTFEDYNTTTKIRLQAGGGTGWSGAWNVLNDGSSSNPTAGTAMVTDTEITYTYGGATLGGGQSLLLNDAANGTQRNVFSSVDDEGGDYYVSMIFQASGSGFVGWQAKDGDAAYLNDSIAYTTSTFGARVQNQSSPGGALTAGTTYFMVMEYTGWNGANYKTVNVWINPNTGDQTNSSVSATYTDADADAGGSSGFVGIYARTASFGSNGMYVDDLRIGTDWASVTAVAVPEPSAASLAAGGVVALCALFNRRRRA
jgi:hypothetical protein